MYVQFYHIKLNGDHNDPITKFNLHKNSIFIKRVIPKLQWYDFFTASQQYKRNQKTTFALTDGKVSTIDKIKNSKNRKKLIYHNRECFGMFNSSLSIYKQKHKKLPTYILYDIDWSNFDTNQVKYYFDLLNQYGMLGEGVNVDQVIKLRTAYIKNLKSLNLNKIYYILSNFRAVREYQSLVEFLNWSHINYGVHPAVALAVGTYVFNWSSGHHYLNRGTFYKRYQTDEYFPANNEIAKISYKIANYLQLNKEPNLLEQYTPTVFTCHRNIVNISIPNEIKCDDLFKFNPTELLCLK